MGNNSEWCRKMFFFPQDIYFLNKKQFLNRRKIRKCTNVAYMFVSPDQKNDLCISSIQIVLIKDKIRSLKTLVFLLLFFY